jgi:RND family efflux transporter MFP subunit
MPTDPGSSNLKPTSTTTWEGGSTRPSRRSLRIAAVVAAVIAVIVVVVGILSRAHETARTRTWTRAQEIPAVATISPTRESGSQNLVLPGALQAFYNAQIYARVSGYVHGWYDDIGAHVKKGEVLATIDTPELDQQLIQARADLVSAQAAMQLAKTTAVRWKTLLAQDAVSKQESDEKNGDFLVKSALVNASEAGVQRLQVLKGFAKITAPFDGFVTTRKIDIGALVNAGAAAAANSELFDVAEVDKLRLYVRTPQSYISRIHPGMGAVITVPEYPGRTFPAVLTSTSNAVNDNSGTLLVELLVQNPGDVLKAGDYAEVTFDLPTTGPTSSGSLRLPSSALLFLKTGLEAAVVGPDDRVHLRPVKVGRDLGSSMEISSGLSTTDRVINNPPDSIAEGELVRVIQPDKVAPAVADRGG